MFPLLEENKFELFLPINPVFTKIFEIAKRQEAQFWSAGEIRHDVLQRDVEQFKHLPKAEQKCIETVLAFFGIADEIVLNNINIDFVQRIKPREIQYFYSFQVTIERIHSEAYSMLLMTYIPDATKLSRLIGSIQTDSGEFKSVAAKHEWMRSYIHHEDDSASYIESDESIGRQLVAWSAIEGIFFSASFAVMGYYKSREKFPAMVAANEFIARDEALHVEAAIEIFQHVQDKPSEDVIRQILMDAVDVELQFVKEAICFGPPHEVQGIFNAYNMALHVKHIANDLGSRFNIDPMYDVDESPFFFMNSFGQTGKHSQFEVISTGYSRQVDGGISDRITEDNDY